MALDEKLRWYGFWMLDGLRGSKVRKYYNQIQNSFKNGTSIAGTEEKIRKLIRHAVRTTKYYQDFGEDTPLSRLPVVNKDTFRQHYDDFLSQPYKNVKDNRLMSTSGSTGTPLTMVQNKDKIDHNTAGGIFLSAAGGYYIGMKEAFIRVWVNNVKKGRLQLLMENMIMMDSSHMDDDGVEQMLRQIEKKQVKCLVGYSSALEQISRYITRTGRDTSGFAVAAIIPISESMAPSLRKNLQLLSQIDGRSGRTVADGGELARIAVSENAVSLFHKRQAVFPDLSAHTDILIPNLLRLLFQEGNDLRHRAVCVFCHHALHPVQRPGKIHGRGTGRVQIFLIFSEFCKKSVIIFLPAGFCKKVDAERRRHADGWRAAHLQQVNGVPDFLRRF